MSQIPINQEELEKRANQLVEAARKVGADAADAVANTSVSVGVEVREGKVEETERSESDALILRVFVGQRVASVSTNRINGLSDLAERAVSMARVTPEDEFAGLVSPELLASEVPALDIFDETGVTPTMLTERAMAAEESGLSVNGVSKSGGASASWNLTGMVLATSHGFSGAFKRSMHSVSMTAIAGEGTEMERDYEFDYRSHLSDLSSPEDVGSKAGDRAIRRLNPRKPVTVSGTVIYEPRVARSLVSHFASAINGEAITRGTSFLKDKLDKQVFPSGIRIFDDPCKPRGAASRPFDGEGVRVEPLILVEDGVLKSWLLDNATARELGLKTNGRASRGASGPFPSSSNLILEPGTNSPEEKLKQIDRGLFVTDLIGRGVNNVTGDYSRGASGFWIENGELKYPVSEITIAGNLNQMYSNLSAANDLDDRFTVCTPTLAVEGLTIGGR